MNIVREEREQGVSLIKINVVEQDYREAVEKMLRDYRKKANIPGFRQGMVPMGIIKKMYGKGAVAEQSYRAASNAAFEWLKSEGIDYLGDVIPSEEQGDFDFDNNTEFEFIFEFAQAPEFNPELVAGDAIEYNTIAIDEKMRGDFRTNYLRRFGRLADVETVVDEEALSVVLENDEMKVDDAYVGLISMSEEERAPFIGQSVGFKTEVNINELYKTASQRAAILQVKEEELEGINPIFNLEITKIRKFAEPELNEEFFKMAFPGGEVATEEQLNAFFDEQIASELRRESDYMFTIQVRKHVIAKAALQLPEGFLKRWLYTINEGKFTMEDIEKDFAAFIDMYTWNFIQKKVAEAASIEIKPEEALEEAKAMAQAQFAQYGMPSAPAEMLENYGQQILSDKTQASKVYEKIYEVKVVETLKAKMNVSEKAISADEFSEIAKTL